MKTIIPFLFLFCSNAVAFDVVRGPASGDFADAYVNVTGDTMTGPLTLSGSSLTVTGSSFSVGTSTLVVSGGKVGVGTASPAQILDIKGGAVSATPQGIVLGDVLGDRLSMLYGSALGITAINQKLSSFIISDAAFAPNTTGLVYVARGNANGQGHHFYTAATANATQTPRMSISAEGSVGIATTAPASTLSIGTPLDGTTNYLQLDTLLADTAGAPAATDCDAATEVGRMVVSSRYSATADNMLWVCLQTAASTYAWWKTALTAP